MTMLQDPRTALLQSAMQGLNGGGASIDSALADLGARDPVAAALLQYMAAQRQTDAEEEEAEEAPEAEVEYSRDEEERRRLEESNEAAAQALRNLRLRVESLYSEMQELRARNRDLAAALGACSHCWGDDARCSSCLGQGKPGGTAPDLYLYARLIAPAARRLNYWDPAAGRPNGVEPPKSETPAARKRGNTK